MGVFAFYCGFIYNEFAALRMPIFNSCYNMEEKDNQMQVNRFTTDCVYPFGIDPVWGVASNDLMFLNSFKMKMSIILGILQMSLGIFLKGANAISFRKPLDFFFEFVP